MTVTTKKIALIQLLFDAFKFPISHPSPIRIFLLWVPMMAMQRPNTSVVTTRYTFATKVFNCLLLVLSESLDGIFGMTFLAFGLTSFAVSNEDEFLRLLFVTSLAFIRRLEVGRLGFQPILFQVVPNVALRAAQFIRNLASTFLLPDQLL